MRRPLDALNFFLADVRDGLGPYLAVYLLTVQKWDEASIGIVMSIAGIAAILAQTPAGALIDSSQFKRGLVVTGAILVMISTLVLPLFPSFSMVAGLQAVSGAAGSIFQPAIAAITLGIVGPQAFTKRTGRNEAFNHAGNATAAILAGATAYFLGPIVVFYVMSIFAVASLISVMMIPASSINHDVARGLIDANESKHRPSAWSILLTDKPLLVFAISVTLFHFANAAMLPLVGQKLSLQNGELGTTYMSGCIVAAQLVMIPMAILVGAKADRWGRKPIFLAGFLILPLRGFLYTLSDDAMWLIAVQALDGIGAGIFGALFPIVVSDLTRGTGHFNVSQGAISTAIGIGAALSTSFAGFIVVRAGYNSAFLFLAVIATIALALFWLAMPETYSEESDSGPQTAPEAA
ncbi:MFS transporter [Methylocella sp. CPCC 101449]|uniref:MFS transporter n=1 Tax=Methylocella sp. CPCC 101449 TaxID=2987531 RepID=UPI002891A8AA|nr:MFS transporter [Methylocella sp. CPCC 101449]MDT2021252.1 MFS transporter [Methylocella sp. CPCC 101449]